MTQLGKVDDPLDASFGAWPADSGDLGQKAGDLALSFAGLIFTPARVFKILRDQFSNSSRFARIDYLLEGIRLSLKALESRFGDAQDQRKASQERLESQSFREAVSVACEESIRTTNSKKIDQFVFVLVGSLTPNKWADPNEDIGKMIRDIAQLGERDLKVLAMLEVVHAPAISSAPNLYEPDAFSREAAALMRDVRSSGIHSDDFLSMCERLRGFGLAAEVLRNPSHMAPHDFCYRPTRRGLAVLTYLGATGSV